MIGKLASAVIGRGAARRAGGNGLLGAAAGIGISILLRRLAPRVTAATARKVHKLLTHRQAAQVNDDTQSAGA